MSVNIRITRNRYVFALFFAAMIAVSHFFIIPLPGGVPIVLKNLFVVLAGTILGSFYGGLSLLIFIAAGLLGAPVFVIPGPGAFATPLGGFIIGYFIASLASGLICGIPKTSEKKLNFFLIIRISIASFLGFAIIIACGVLYVMRLNSISFTAAMITWCLPFIPGDLIKLAICIPLTLKLRPIAARYINSI